MTKLTRMSLAAALAATFTAVPALADKGGVPNGGNGSDNPNAAKPATPAEPGAAGGGATPATPAQPAPKAKKPKKPKKAHPGKPAAAPKAAKAPKADKPKTAKTEVSDADTPKPANTHAKAGKTTICHSTGSETNPYVTITVSDNAVKAHARHHDGRDIIPAPAEGCPAPATTGEGTAPATNAPATGESPAAGGEATTAGSSASTRSVNGEVAGVSATGLLPVLGQQVLGASSSSAPASGSAPGSLPIAETTAAQEAGDGLPFTGLDLAIIALMGLGALLAGVALRRTMRARSSLTS